MGFPINQANAQKAVWRATQDMKAAVRFFRKDAATTNTYKTDPNFIFVGGYSAGAFMAVQYAYLDQSSEVPAAIDTTTLGGLEGNSGNPGYCSAINGVLNLAGAVGDTSWMQPGDEPMVTAQGDNDATVPYCTAMIYVSGFPIMVVSGGGTMHIRCFHQGIENPIHTYYGQDHPADVRHRGAAGALPLPAARYESPDRLPCRRDALPVGGPDPRGLVGRRLPRPHFAPGRLRLSHQATAAVDRAVSDVMFAAALRV